MVVTFHGVRGSIPSPGPETVRYGGNTSCVHVKLNNGIDLILDSGTGIRTLGASLVQQDDPLYLLLSHRHWDHIQGFPFFLPIYQKERQIHIYSGAEAGDDVLSILRQMDGATFPVRAGHLPAIVENLTSDTLESHLQASCIVLSTQSLNHPGGGRAFRIEEDGVSIAYVTDNELDPPGQVTTRYEQWVSFCHRVDLLVHDAQYVKADMPHKHGWGHSLISQVRQLALDAEVRALVMFHHDPERSDAELQQIERDNALFFRGKRLPARSIVAFEGLTLRLTAGSGKPVRHRIDVL